MLNAEMFVDYLNIKNMESNSIILIVDTCLENENCYADLKDQVIGFVGSNHK